MTRKVLLLGATGLVGRELLPLLLDDPTIARVVVLARRPLGITHAKLEEHPFALDERLFAVDQIFCALGTTMRVAGSEEKFRHVDHDLPIEAAKLGFAHGATHYLLVSSHGASARSRVFYNRVKGETENDLLAHGHRSVTIARPSFLRGAREEFRLGERIVLALGWLMPKSVKPVDVRRVARALAEAARENRPGVRILTSREMQR
ncbi:MAG TPA: NAD-dependent dehydratase [Thermoanaerobaculia bacterium]|nr:NAD-dependent dehydratase [Thermoanaerobaculia bacterium]